MKMAPKLVECEHCEGQGTCTASGGQSCRHCLNAAGRGRRQGGTVRCSYCGGRGKVWVEGEEDEQSSAESDDSA